MADLHQQLNPETRPTNGVLPLRPRRDEAEAGLVAPQPRESAPGDLAAASLYRRAVEAAIWGMPLVSFDALRQAYLSDAGARLHDVVFWSEPANWKFQAPTPSLAARHVLFFVSVEDEPIVVDIPAAGKAALSGTLVDSWNLPLADVGTSGADRGMGAKYLLLPPEHEARHSQGLLPVKSATYNIYGLLRLIPRSESDEDLDEAVAYLKQIKIQPLSGRAPPRRPRYIDMADRKFEATAPWDSGFYAALARMVDEEPVKPRDQTMMGLLRSIGIGKDFAFQPDAATEEILGRAIAEAHAFMADGRRRLGAAQWPDRQWRVPASEEARSTGGTFMARDHVLIDERAFAFFGSFGLARSAPADFQLESFADAAGARLDGSRAYRLRIPADIPTAPAWSVAVYDAETAAFVREAPAVGVDSRDPDLRRNEDGSVDVDLAPARPGGRPANWIATAEGRPFFLVFRIHAPEAFILEQNATWTLGDAEPVD